MENEPWESLDIDDSDLSMFVSPSIPSSGRTPSVPPLIPGPAGAVQAVMLNHNSTNPIPTNEFMGLVACQNNLDFTTGAWGAALEFITSQGYVDANADPCWTTLDSVKNLERANLVVAIVKACKPNGFGDLVVTLKDPTGTVDGTVHRSVFRHGVVQAEYIHVGCALVLQEVAVFCPNRTKCYLNITLRNVTKVFSKDESSPSHSTST